MKTERHSDLMEPTVEQLLERYTNALVVAVSHGWSHESPDAVDAKVRSAKEALLKRLRQIERGQGKAVRDAVSRLQRLERRLARIGRIAIEEA